MAQVSGAQSRAGWARQLVIGTLGEPCAAERTLDDLRLAGFVAQDVALVAREDERLQAAGASAGRWGRFGERVAVVCHGLGTLLIVGGAMPPLRALEPQASIAELGQAFIDAGLPDADALIYELGLIRGQCLLIVAASTPERVHAAYRLLLRCGSAEVHIYRP